MHRNYYGACVPLKRLRKGRSISQMLADDFMKKTLNKACDDLIDSNQNKWLHFERRFMTEINRLRDEIKQLGKAIQKECNHEIEAKLSHHINDHHSCTSSPLPRNNNKR